MASFLKELLQFCYPISGCLILLLPAVIFLWRGSHPKTTRALVTLAFSYLLISSNGWVGPALLSKREYPEPAQQNPITYLQSFSSETLPQIDVVVLGGGVSPYAGLPPTSELSGVSVLRLTEGIRMHRALGDRSGKLILSGRGNKDTSEARTMANLATQLGFDPEKIVTEEASMNTGEQASFLHSMLGTKPFALVTSASHMPRALEAFKNSGLHPVAAPTGHRTRPESTHPFLLRSTPRSTHIRYFEEAIYESLAGFHTRQQVSKENNDREE